MGKMSYYDMSKCLCKELACEFEKFEEDKCLETLKGIKDLIESMVGLAELEASDAMRDYFEDEHGYDSHRGEFRNRLWDDPYRIQNAARRYPTTVMTGGTHTGPSYTGMPYGGDYDMYDGMYMNRVDGRMERRDGRMDHRMDMDIYDRVRSRDSRGRYNGGRDGYGIYNMAHRDDMKRKDKLSDKEIKEWMENLESNSGERGPMWTKEEIESIAKKDGIKFDKFSEEEFYAIVNSMYADYCEVGEKFGVDKPSFYVALAKCFMDDPDAIGGGGSEKLAAYYEYVVEH